MSSLPKPRTKMAGDIVVCGPLGSVSGIGQGARQTIEILSKLGLTVRSANASHIIPPADFDAGPLWPEQALQGGILLFHVNADVLGLLCSVIGRRRLLKRHIIGMWAWETENPPASWSSAVGLVDEIWVPSQFTANAIRKISGDVPVYVVPHPLDVSAARQVPKNDPLPEWRGKKVVFFSYDVRSYHARKNPEAVVSAYRLAVGNASDCVLVIKINNSSAWPESEARVRQAASGLDNVVILKKKLSDDEMLDLMARVDIVMSLHRSEGFGLLMASAMAAGKPVIATGWSGNLDFMTDACSVLVDYRLIPVDDPQGGYGADSVWADPDIHQAAEALKLLLKDEKMRDKMGQAARKQAELFFSWRRWLDVLPVSVRDVVSPSSTQSIDWL